MSQTSEAESSEEAADSESTNGQKMSSLEEADAKDYFSDRDLSGEVDESDAITISLNGNTALADSDKVSINGTTITIKEEGTYILEGNLQDGNIIIDADQEAKVQLVLNGATINSKTFAPIYVINADKTFVTLSSGTENELSNGGSFTQIDDNNVDAVIFSKDDLTINGSGSLTINSPAGHGIVSKDEITITGGILTITSAQTAIKANDGIAIAGGSFTLNADSDGLHAENDDDDSLGYIYIKDGTFNIMAGDDGIHATTTLVVDGGDFDIQAVEGMEATNITINDGNINIQASDDGINASSKSSAYSVKITFNGGNTTIVMGAGDTDGVDANGDIEINGGTIDVTGNSTFDYDNTGVINGGTVIVNGEEVTTLPEQMMGGPGKMNGTDKNGGQGGPGAPDGEPGNMGPRPDDMGRAPRDMNGGV